MNLTFKIPSPPPSLPAAKIRAFSAPAQKQGVNSKTHGIINQGPDNTQILSASRPSP